MWGCNMGNFKVGDKVICIETTNTLIKDKIYTIRFVGPTEYHIMLNEVDGWWLNVIHFDLSPDSFDIGL